MPTLVLQVPRQEAACLVSFLASKAHVPAGELFGTTLTDPVLLQVQSSVMESIILVPHAVLRRAGIGGEDGGALCVVCRCARLPRQRNFPNLRPISESTYRDYCAGL